MTVGGFALGFEGNPCTYRVESVFPSLILQPIWPDCRGNRCIQLVLPRDADTEMILGRKLENSSGTNLNIADLNIADPQWKSCSRLQLLLRASRGSTVVTARGRIPSLLLRPSGSSQSLPQECQVVIGNGDVLQLVPTCLANPCAYRCIINSQEVPRPAPTTSQPAVVLLPGPPATPGSVPLPEDEQAR